ncbi:class I SAM-dependent methyltransferase [uncultured Ruegeria sp.]|uniref:class I SAM-dependent methyltransferase n=1 Tax=uncultured Ruegeria sp. TaxID=259304 RepID=UPI00260593FA|nr:class I SAM-dependent methyltransferase [uncultured Ruegeria sp.]
MGWMDHLLKEFGKFERALFVSCGDGWVERDCFQAGLIGHAIGFDILPELLETARTEAAKIRMPSTYSVEDGNKINLPKGGYNLVVNNGACHHGACHHIAFLGRLLREVNGALAPDGLYVIIDYTAPHWNQYSWAAWEQIIKANVELTRTAPETNLFTFAICRPKGTSEMPSQEQLDAWTEE